MSIKEKEKQEKLRRNKLTKTDFISEEEYLERELLAETKSEYHNGKIVAMAGAQPEHNQIASNLAGQFYICLRGLGCKIYIADALVHLPACNKHVYPDITITCHTPEFAQKKKNGLKVLLNPQIVIEVLSESTAEYDLNGKMKCYIKLKSLQEYVVVSSKEKSIIIHKKDENGEIRTKIYEDDETVQIGSCKILMKDIYEQVDFEQEQENETEGNTE